MPNSPTGSPTILWSRLILSVILACFFCLTDSSGKDAPAAEPLSQEEHVQLAPFREWRGIPDGIFLKEKSDGNSSLFPAIITRQRFRCEEVEDVNQDPTGTVFYLYRIVARKSNPQFSFSVCSPTSSKAAFLEFGLANSSSGISYLWWVTGDGKLYLVPLTKPNESQVVLQRYLQAISGDSKAKLPSEQQNAVASYGLACASVVLDIRQILGSSSHRSSRVTLSPRWGSPVVRVDEVIETADGCIALRLLNPNLTAVFVLKRIAQEWVLVCEGDLHWDPDPARKVETEDESF